MLAQHRWNCQIESNHPVCSPPPKRRIETPLVNSLIVNGIDDKTSAYGTPYAVTAEWILRFGLASHPAALAASTDSRKTSS
jgi:hypothetical protein